jgi:hypothetical protein
MKIKITRSHINSNGPVQVGTILDLPEPHAVDLLNAKLAVPHTEESSSRKPIEQATRTRKGKETR